MKAPTPPAFDSILARRRCAEFRHRILDISQTVSALHCAAAFSCIEIVDAIYFGLMRRDRPQPDTFILSKGHGSMAQYVVLERLGVLSREELDLYCKHGGKLGCHPDYGVPGIEASTGSLGHGLPMAIGMALADRALGHERTIYVVLSDGELQEGSTWEAMMVAPSLGVTSVVAVVDLNDFQSYGRTSETHPNFYPVLDKIQAFGWQTSEVDGHHAGQLIERVQGRQGDRPMMLVARTTKGKGISYMENVPIWHYRSPNAEEYRQALRELEPELNA